MPQRRIVLALAMLANMTLSNILHAANPVKLAFRNKVELVMDL
jgi:hypothetical protein